MELQDLESDVQALRKLYGLLRCYRNYSQSACSEYLLDEKAKIFLKSLLDGATERILEAYSKLTSVQFGVFEAPPDVTELEKLEGMPILQPPVSKYSPTQFVASDLPSAIPPRELIRRIGMSQKSKQAASLGSMGLTNRKFQVADSGLKLSGTPREKGLPNQIITRPTLPAKNRSQCVLSTTVFGNVMDQNKGGVQKSSKWVAQREKVLPPQQESEATIISPSRWTSQEASSHTREQGDMGSASSSDIEGYSLPGRTVGHHYMDPTSSSESEGYRVQARHHMDLSSRVVSSPSTSVGSVEDSRSDHQVKLKKQIGGFRRLKDKLALVFHRHHHHHHHHHHHYGDGDHRDQKTQAGRGKFLWKNAGKIFHGKSKEEAYGEQVGEQHRKSVVCKVADKNQHGHFHKLVKGLLGQARKSNLSKGGVKRLGGNQGGGKKVVNLFRRQKARKPRSKPGVKVGFGSKQPTFKTLPQMR